MGNLKKDIGIEYTKCNTWRIDPTIKGFPPSADKTEELDVEGDLNL